MDNNLCLTNENPQKPANVLSKTFFIWFIKLCAKCTKQQLGVKDLYKNLSSDGSSLLCSNLEKNWNVEIGQKNGKKPSLLKAILKTYYLYYLLYGIIQFIQFTFIYSIQPLLLELFINLFSSSLNENKNNVGWMCLYGGSIAMVSLVIAIINNHMTLRLCQLGMRIRIACCSLVYKKIFSLNQSSMNAGQIVNLLSNDVSRFDLMSFFINHIWIMPLQVTVVTYFIWQHVHIASIIGVGSFLVLTIPANALFGKVISILRLKIAEKTDNRVTKMAEIVSGIQIIKMYTWEKPFANLVSNARIAEINILKWASYIRGMIISSSAFMQRTILFITVTSYVLLGNTITPNKVFPILQFVNILQLSLAVFFPLALTFGGETWVSINRLQEFLLLKENETPKITKNSDKLITLKDVDASWDGQQKVLKNINFQIESGSLCAIIGPVGSGKSSLLNLLLGELVQEKGTINLNGEISYASQEPWLFASTVRKNILFGQKFDQKLYSDVIKVCALERDLMLLPKGDETIVGERGVSLSGGQRARINMARCIYRQADIYILDDPLSAVDSHVGHHLFEKCIREYLKDKTRILVTHQLQYLRNADHIICLEDGEIKVQGNYEKVSQFNLAFTGTLMPSEHDDDEENKVTALKEIEIRTESPSQLETESKSNDPEITKNDDDEETFEENVSLISTLWEYSRAGGNVFILAGLLFFFVIAQAASIAADLWVSIWTEQEVIRISSACNIADIDFYSHNTTVNVLSGVKYDFQENSTSSTISKVKTDCSSLISTNTAMYIYTALVISSILLMLYRGIYFYQIVMSTSKNLHNRMFTSLLQSPMRFFNINPSGRILNRFSRDMGMIDEILPRMMLEAVQIVLSMISIFIVVSITNPYMIIVTLLIGFLFNKLRSSFMLIARNLKHLEGIARSPVFSHVSASVNGIATIRSAGSEEILIEEFDKHQDTHTGAWYLTLVCNGGFGIWIDCLCGLYITTVMCSFIILSQFNEISGSSVGLAVAQSLVLTGSAQYGMFQMAQVVSHMTSVERILEYTKLENEQPKEISEDKTLDSSWPSLGNIIFKNVFLKYCKTEESVLKDLNFNIHAGQKIGIVGRTGAGKSSIISALFLLAPLEGKILIDEIDTQRITLNQLRKKISIIPQEPILFSATLRFNLDPFQEFSDDSLWQALEDVELKNSISSLDFLVQESGNNFSVGQRQLICLARAILRKNKILVLDEATANVDPVTDKLIQKTIRQKFELCTVLTIAHRLHTIMDADKVMVMDAGKLIQFDHPYQLLRNTEGCFAKMVSQTGSLTAGYLEGIARESCSKVEEVEESSDL